jgi:CHAT domain-containing protein
VVLAACESGQNAVRAGDELLGLGAVLLARGTAQLVGSLVPVPDAETSTLMNALHLGLAAGLSPATALARAQAEAAAAGPAGAAAAAGFVCFGAGFLPVLPEPSPSHPRNGTPVASALDAHR